MAGIKVRDIAKKDIKTLNKGVIATQKLKDNIVEVKEKTNSATQKEDNINEYGSNKINNITAFSVDKGTKEFNKQGQKSLVRTKENLQKSKIKIKAFKEKRLAKRTAKNTTKNTKTAIKTSKEVAKNAQKAAKESAKASKRAKQVARETAKRTAQGIKVVVKVTISSLKAIIAGTKSLISVIIAGGWVAVVVIIVICLVGLLVSSIFGIFFSSEKTSANAITMNEVVAECNQEFANKLQSIQDSNPHDDYVLDGSMAPWKDILLIYTIKQSNGKNETDVVTIDDNKKKIIKEIFWDMNSLSPEVKEETVTERGVNVNEEPKEVQKNVLHIKITSKSVEDMKSQYSFNTAQNNQLAELSSDKYASLWNGIIYGIQDSSEFINWRQSGANWSNIRIGNTNSTIGDIGCLVTSLAILIEKSGVSTLMTPFNPGTFVETLNNNGGFDIDGNLQYEAINRVVPEFKYVGNVNLTDKTREEKLALITQYFNQGYYITAEVKGATEGNQHWVAIIGINGNNIVMVDPASNHTDLWNAYEFSKTSQFQYFKVN